MLNSIQNFGEINKYKNISESVLNVCLFEVEFVNAI